MIHVYHERADTIRDAVVGLGTAHDVIALGSRAELAAALGTIEVLFAPEPPRDGWAGAGALRLIQLLGVGADHFLPSPDLPDRVEVCGARGEFAVEVAEHVIAMILALRRRVPELLDDQRAHRWRQRPRGAVAGEAVTILGAGAIGARIARLCAALDLRVTLISRTGGERHGVASRPVAELGAAVDGAHYLVNAAPLTPATARLIDASVLARLPRGAFVIDVGRGGVIDESALLAALTAGHLGGAALDVFAEEPLPATSPWWSAPGVIVTSHVAGYGERYIERCARLLLDNVARLEAGVARVGVIDRSHGY